MDGATAINADFTKAMQFSIDYSGGFMGTRCKRFALVANNNNIVKLFVEESGQFSVSSAENLLKNL